MNRVALARLWRGWTTARRLSHFRQQVPRILAAQQPLNSLDDVALARASLALRYRAQTGEPLAHLLIDGFALVREAARRKVGMEHYDVQLIAGAALHRGSVVEMQTGEGKTLTATLPLYLAALAGRGAHLATANDYLAQRDADLMRPVFERLGMSIGAITSASTRSERRAAYACDVTYGTAKEFGFDFLRDRLQISPQPVQREPFAMLVDEADSLLIDEARTPLVVSGMPDASERDLAAIYRWAARVAPEFVAKEHYLRDTQSVPPKLTPLGRRRVRELAASETSLPQHAPLVELYEHIEKAIRASQDYLHDRHYIVRGDEVVIVDEFTGRLAEGRRWRDGLHQAVEAREGVPIGFATDDAARITLQDYMLRYEHLAGMTGTIATAAHELTQIYKTPVIVVPTHRPPQREQSSDRVFGTSAARWEAIVAEVCELHSQGRPVLVGTRSIDKSETLSQMLSAAGLPHEVLNARHLSREAEIVAAAGERGRITIATNMAGRGTDIRLGKGVGELGGLHVIISELHESARIDRQLIGRCGRQGDPGSFRTFMSVEDDILRAGLGQHRAQRLARKYARQTHVDHLAPLFRRAQARVERDNFLARARLLKYEADRRQMQQQLGQDPYLDAA